MTKTIDNELAAAATAGDADRVREILANGVSPDAQNDGGQSAIALAASRNHVDVVQICLDYGADPNGAGSDPTPARAACTLAATDALRVLISAGADPNASHDDGQSLLAGTILAEGTTRKPDYLQVAGMLLEAGADINAADHEGATPLTRAVVLGRSETVRWLLVKGADPNLGGSQGLSLVQIAKARKQHDVERLLLAHGAK